MNGSWIIHELTWFMKYSWKIHDYWIHCCHIIFLNQIVHEHYMNYSWTNNVPKQLIKYVCNMGLGELLWDDNAHLNSFYIEYWKIMLLSTCIQNATNKCSDWNMITDLSLIGSSCTNWPTMQYTSCWFSSKAWMSFATRSEQIEDNKNV